MIESVCLGKCGGVLEILYSVSVEWASVIRRCCTWVRDLMCESGGWIEWCLC